MGDTLFQAATEFSNDNDMFKIWDKAQVMVGCIRTRIGRNNIFSVDKSSTIDAINSLIQLINQWKDYIELVLKLILANSEAEMESLVFNQDNSFTFRICDISLL